MARTKTKIETKAAKEPPRAEGGRIAKGYSPTPDEQRAREAIRGRKKTPRILVDDTARTLKLDHPQPDYGQCLLMETLSIVEPDFLTAFIQQLSQAATRSGKVDEQALNFLLTVIKGVEPRDQLETMLAAQLGAIHMLTMDFAGRLANAENLPQQDFAERTLNKLARTFATQLETLKRYRSDGSQKITVQHLAVNDGGQAIVGVVSHQNGGPGGSEKREPIP